MTTEDTVIPKRWYLDGLQRDVERLFDKNQRLIVDQCLRTIGERRAFARYHFNEAKNKMDAVTRDRADHELTGMILGAHDTNELSFDDMRFEAYAHTIACVQNIHAVADNMVHFVYYVLGLNRDLETKIENERNITWSNVRKKLPPGAIKDDLASMMTDPSFVYLAALNNHSKHRSIIEVNYSISFESDTHGLRFAPFTYDGVSYPAEWVHPLLRNGYQREEDLIFSIGANVNAELANRS